jgi:hypothetical protein
MPSTRSAPVINTVVFAALMAPPGPYSQRDCRHVFVARHIRDDDEIIFTKAIPAADEFAPGGLARCTAHGFNSVLRVLELSGS